MYEEPDETNTADFSNETMMAWIQLEIWSYTVDTRLYDNTETNAITGIPFDFMTTGINASMIIDWGDGTTNTYTSTHLYRGSEGSTTNIHTYSNPGIYTVKISSYYFKNIRIYATNDTNYSGTASTGGTLDYFRKTVIRINNKLPELLNTASNYSGLGFRFTFKDCIHLLSIPSGLFDDNITNFNTFYGCFAECTSLTSIPQDLFKYNTTITTFANCFNNCRSFTSIPTDLFRYNTAVTSFSACFRYCSSLTDFTIHIGSSSVSTVTNFVTNKSGTTRTVYVPTGSTTQTNFNSVASSLGLTIIGE